nr:immunoglobulin heavy chain junction region [Macaca mulatta]
CSRDFTIFGVLDLVFDENVYENPIDYW